MKKLLMAILLCAAYPLRSADIQWQQIKGGNVQAVFSENSGRKQVTVTSASGYALYRFKAVYLPKP